MKKRLLLTAIIFSMSLFCFAQEVEKIAVLKDINHIEYKAAQGSFPTGLYMDEITMTMAMFDPHDSEFYYVNISNSSNPTIKKESKSIPYYPCIYKVGNDFWGASYYGLTYIINNSKYNYIEDACSGISFILKKNNGYIVYFVDKQGLPGAVDTEGKIYTNKEAIAYLKQYDSEKYAESLLRAEEIGLKNAFENAEVLVWGKRYYSTFDKMEKVLGKSGLILYGLIQYDMQGNAYQIEFDWWGNYKNDWGKLCDEGTEDNSDFVCEDVKGNRIVLLSNLNSYSKILGSNGDYQETRPEYSTGYYVGFGGNIYYYIAGEAYTEVFRIRRTWGAPDFYAMAINGYTDDNYGKYVNEVLPTLSKADLRLLRNTIFAIYGVHFKSTDLSKYFEKQVWYTDAGKTSGEVTLSAHRQKLVEMIQKLEKQ